MSYPSHRQPVPVYWLARADVPLDCPPLPARRHPRARTLRIRACFLTDWAGRATVADILTDCVHEGLLAGLTAASQLEVVRKALRPVATDNVWDSRFSPALRQTSRPG
jgi:hypothetical protein